jgi:replication factor A1
MTSISAGKGAGGGGGSSAWKTFADVKLENLGNGEKPDYYTAKAMVAMINKERALYMACPSADCNKKVRFSILLAWLSISFHRWLQVVDLNNGLYRCEKCQQEFQDYKWRVMLSVNITDFTDHQWVTCFQEAAETLLGKYINFFILFSTVPNEILNFIGRSADELGRLKDSDSTQFQKVFEDATFKWFVFRLRVKMEMYNVCTNICILIDIQFCHKFD